MKSKHWAYTLVHSTWQTSILRFAECKIWTYQMRNGSSTRSNDLIVKSFLYFCTAKLWPLPFDIHIDKPKFRFERLLSDLLTQLRGIEFSEARC